MNEDDLKELADSLDGGKAVELVQYIPELIDDVRRLRGLIKAKEHSGGDSNPGCCPWCGAFRATENAFSPQTPHRVDCPAFTPDGEAK